MYRGCNLSKGKIMPKKITKEEFYKRIEYLSEKLDFSKTIFIDSSTKFIAICKKHSFEFLTTLNSLQNNNINCKFCIAEKHSIAGLKQIKDINFFLEKAIKIHGNKYDYSQSVYKGAGNKIKIICPIHGEFEQIASHHWCGNGCNKCKGDLISKTKQKNKKIIFKPTKKEKDKD